MKKQLAILMAMIAVIFFLISVTMVFSEGTNIPSTWAEEGIEELKSTNNFKEEAFENYHGNITRKEFIYIAVRLFELFNGEEIVIDPTISFIDTDNSYALKGATVGITEGVGEGKFAPNQLLTREQLAVFMIRTLNIGKLELNELNGYKFNDEEEFSSWSKNSIYLAKANGIVKGEGNDIFNSQGTATIEQALLIANNILKNTDKTTWIYQDTTKKEQNNEIEIIEGIEFNKEEDLTEAGVVTVDIVEQLSQIAFDNLVFWKDNETGKLMVEGYVPEAPEGFVTDFRINITYYNSIPVHATNFTYGGKYYESYDYETLYYSVESIKDLEYAMPKSQYVVKDGETFECEILGDLENIKGFGISYKVSDLNETTDTIRVVNYLERKSYINGDYSDKRPEIREVEINWEEMFLWLN